MALCDDICGGGEFVKSSVLGVASGGYSIHKILRITDDTVNNTSTAYFDVYISGDFSEDDISNRTLQNLSIDFWLGFQVYINGSYQTHSEYYRGLTLSNYTVPASSGTFYLGSTTSFIIDRSDIHPVYGGRVSETRFAFYGFPNYTFPHPQLGDWSNDSTLRNALVLLAPGHRKPDMDIVSFNYNFDANSSMSFLNSTVTIHFSDNDLYTQLKSKYFENYNPNTNNYTVRSWSISLLYLSTNNLDKQTYELQSDSVHNNDPALFQYAGVSSIGFTKTATSSYDDNAQTLTLGISTSTAQKENNRIIVFGIGFYNTGSGPGSTNLIDTFQVYINCFCKLPTVYEEKIPLMFRNSQLVGSPISQIKYSADYLSYNIISQNHTAYQYSGLSKLGFTNNITSPFYISTLFGSNYDSDSLENDPRFSYFRFPEHYEKTHLEMRLKIGDAEFGNWFDARPTARYKAFLCGYSTNFMIPYNANFWWKDPNDSSQTLTLPSNEDVVVQMRYRISGSDGMDATSNTIETIMYADIPEPYENARLVNPSVSNDYRSISGSIRVEKPTKGRYVSWTNGGKSVKMTNTTGYQTNSKTILKTDNTQVYAGGIYWPSSNGANILDRDSPFEIPFTAVLGTAPTSDSTHLYASFSTDATFSRFLGGAPIRVEGQLGLTESLSNTYPTIYFQKSNGNPPFPGNQSPPVVWFVPPAELDSWDVSGASPDSPNTVAVSTIARLSTLKNFYGQISYNLPNGFGGLPALNSMRLITGDSTYRYGLQSHLETRYSLDSGNTWSNWVLSGETHNDGTSIDATISGLPFNSHVVVQGRQYWVEEGGYSVVDEIEFDTPPNPPEVTLSSQTWSDMSMSPIINFTYEQSGVNLLDGSTLESMYRFSTDGGNTYNNWTTFGTNSAQGAFTAGTTGVSLADLPNTLPFGTEIIFQFRAVKTTVDSVVLTSATDELTIITDDLPANAVTVAESYDALRRETMSIQVDTLWISTAKSLTITVTDDDTSTVISRLTTIVNPWGVTTQTFTHQLFDNATPVLPAHDYTISVVLRNEAQNRTVLSTTKSITTPRPILGIAIAPNGVQSYITDIATTEPNETLTSSKLDVSYKRFIIKT